MEPQEIIITTGGVSAIIGFMFVSMISLLAYIWQMVRKDKERTDKRSIEDKLRFEKLLGAQQKTTQDLAIIVTRLEANQKHLQKKVFKT